MGKNSCPSKTLGILSIVLGVIIPFVGIVLGIIGLSFSKPKHLKNTCVALNIVGICVSLFSWIFWFSMVMVMFAGI